MLLLLHAHPLMTAIACGGLIGLVLALIGGGGSVLATPMLVYVIGLGNPHLAIGTGAIGVAANAAMALAGHARAGRVHWRSGALFALCGLAGASLGSSLGKLCDAQWLLRGLSVLMLVVAASMASRCVADEDAATGEAGWRRLAGFGAGSGALAGFFGIGGGFLIVPGLARATGMSTAQAVATSLVAVTAFGATTAANYALSGLVDWPVAAALIAGGLLGAGCGGMVAGRLTGGRDMLRVLFSTLVAVMALAMLASTFH
jgi:uncharacterized membrane protein YfcA